MSNKSEAKEIKDSNDVPEETMLGAALNWREAEGKGRGIFARRLIKKGEVIECAPVVTVAEHNIPEDGGPPEGYVLEWDEDDAENRYALVLGYIMFYNHGENPNVHLESDFTNKVVTVTAIRDIKPDEEITWDYNCEIWFDTV
jgi:SET domain-containing protein